MAEGASIADVFAGLGSQIFSYTTSRPLMGARAGGGYVEVTPPLALVGDLDAIVAHGGDLAKAMLAAMIDAAVGALSAEMADPTQYGVRQVVHALLAGKVAPIVLTEDPERGIFSYGAGRIPPGYGEGSSPPHSIATFIAQYRMAHPRTGARRPRARKPVPERVPRMSARERKDERILRQLGYEREHAILATRLRETDARRKQALSLGQKADAYKLARAHDLLTAEQFVLETPLPRAVIAQLSSMAGNKTKEVSASFRTTGAGRKVQVGGYTRIVGGRGLALVRAYGAEAQVRGASTLVFKRSRVIGGRYKGAAEGRVSHAERRAQAILGPGSALMRRIQTIDTLRLHDLLRVVPIAEEAYVTRGPRTGNLRKAFNLRDRHILTNMGAGARAEFQKIVGIKRVPRKGKLVNKKMVNEKTIDGRKWRAGVIQLPDRANPDEAVAYKVKTVLRRHRPDVRVRGISQGKGVDRRGTAALYKKYVPVVRSKVVAQPIKYRANVEVLTTNIEARGARTGHIFSYTPLTATIGRPHELYALRRSVGGYFNKHDKDALGKMNTLFGSLGSHRTRLDQIFKEAQAAKEAGPDAQAAFEARAFTKEEAFSASVYVERVLEPVMRAHINKGG